MNNFCVTALCACFIAIPWAMWAMDREIPKWKPTPLPDPMEKHDGGWWVLVKWVLVAFSGIALVGISHEKGRDFLIWALTNRMETKW